MAPLNKRDHKEVHSISNILHWVLIILRQVPLQGATLFAIQYIEIFVLTWNRLC